MIRSLRTGITGLRGHQTKMDVTGNNIANVNTVAFKRSRAVFKEMLGQNLVGSSNTVGGVNTSFIGFGVSVGAIGQNWQQGAMESTGIATDLALNGDGFFVLDDAGRQLLTRDGSFLFDANGNLTTSDGINVQGYPIDSTTGQADTTQLGNITADFSSRTPPTATTGLTAAGNLSGESVNGDTFNMTRVIYDEQGEAHTVDITFTKTANANEWDYALTYAGDLGTNPFTEPTGTITFGVDGTLAANTNISFDWDANFVSGGPTMTVSLDGLTQFAGSNTGAIIEQDGTTFGELTGFNISDQGFLNLNYSNGDSVPIFQLAIAKVSNLDGLSSLGENYYAANADSGEATIGRAGVDVSTQVISGSLEASNVDLSQEFTDMIVSQRGYQAAARIITVSDEILSETVNLKR